MPVSALREIHAKGDGAATVISVAGLATPVPVLHPDQPLDLALRLISDHAVLPIVHRADSRLLVGIISLAHILASYRRSAAASP